MNFERTLAGPLRSWRVWISVDFRCAPHRRRVPAGSEQVDPSWDSPTGLNQSIPTTPTTETAIPWLNPFGRITAGYRCGTGCGPMTPLPP